MESSLRNSLIEAHPEWIGKPRLRDRRIGKPTKSIVEYADSHPAEFSEKATDALLLENNSLYS